MPESRRTARPPMRDLHARPRAVVADELALARLGIATVLQSLGVDVVAETHSGREVMSIAMLERPDVVVIGITADLPLVDSVRRVLRIRPRPTVVVLLPLGGEHSVRYLVAMGTAGIALRVGSPDELATVISSATKGEQHVVPALHRALVGAVRPVAAAGDDDDPPLSAREREVLALLAEGRTNGEIAAELSVATATVKSHLVRLYTKLGATNRNEALGRAVAKGLLR